MIGGHRALRLLARRKLIGILRKQVRRLKTRKGALLALIGFAAISLWIWSLLTGGSWGSVGPTKALMTPQTVRLVIGLIALVSMFSALSFRGLYLPREEIELLFAAPLSRSDVIRYRLWVSLCKSSFGCMFFGLIVSRSTPVPVFGFIGVFLLTMSLPLAAQIVSLYAGNAENRWVHRIPKGAFRTFNLICLLLILAFVFFPGGNRPSLDLSQPMEMLKSIPVHPLVSALSLPMWPWATLIYATDALQFFALLGFCLGIWWLLYEACARTNIDYRELSLETSADVARRISRMHRGAAGAAAGTAEASSAGWRVPWLFGRGAFGALAWRKSGTILRKARGTLLISGGLVLLLVLFTTFMFKSDVDPRRSALFSSAVIALAGTVYLCAGLRFDFREDLDRMDVVRSWPMATWRVFLATILPEVVLVAVLLMLAIVLRTAIARSFPFEVFAILAALTPTVLGWVAIDNAVFLVAPVRPTPGQDGMLQQAGRSLVLMLFRILAVAVSGGLVFGCVATAWFGQRWFGYSESAATLLASIGGFIVLCAECVFLVHLGGRALARFDVARDR